MNRNSQWKEAVLNEKFLKLPEEKQRKIIYSAVRVFAEKEYRYASTDRMANWPEYQKDCCFSISRIKNRYTFMCMIT